MEYLCEQVVNNFVLIQLIGIVIVTKTGNQNRCDLPNRAIILEGHKLADPVDLLT